MSNKKNELIAKFEPQNEPKGLPLNFDLSEWIPVNHQLPEVGKPILGLNASTGEMNVVWVGVQRELIERPTGPNKIKNTLRYGVKIHKDTLWGREAFFHPETITHWMLLPEPIK